MRRAEENHYIINIYYCIYVCARVWLCVCALLESECFEDWRVMPGDGAGYKLQDNRSLNMMEMNYLNSGYNVFGAGLNASVVFRKNDFGLIRYMENSQSRLDTIRFTIYHRFFYYIFDINCIFVLSTDMQQNLTANQ